MDVTASNAAGRAGSLGNLGLGLRDRYAHTGAVVDLDLAITAFQQALELTPAEHPDRPGNLNNLGLGLHDLYLRTGSPSDLEAAIAAFQAALEATPAASADRPMYLGNLGTGLRLRYATTGTPADLEAAIEVYRQAVDATPIEAIEPGGPPHEPWERPERKVRTDRRPQAISKPPSPRTSRHWKPPRPMPPTGRCTSRTLGAAFTIGMPAQDRPPTSRRPSRHSRTR